MKYTKADRIWIDAVKQRENWTCQRCGKSYVEGDRGIQAHHLWTRTRRSTKTVLLNGVCLCTGCHRWAHANPIDFHEVMRERLGADQYDELRRLSYRTKASA